MPKLILIYTTKTCPYCRMAKEYLTEKGQAFKEVDVQDDDKAAQEMIEKSGQMGVPVIDVEGKIVIGFDKDALKEALEIKE